MKYFIVALACIASAAALTRSPVFGGFNNFQPKQYQYNQYNRYQQPQYRYQQPQYQQPQYQYQQYTTPRPVVSVTPVFEPVPVVTAAPTYAPVVAAKVYNGDARSANIVKLGNDISPDGSYNYFYETDNGIAAQAQGVPRVLNGNPPVAPVVSQGSFSWTSPEGQPISITYVADENGYQPQGSAIPVAPEVPPQIARALAYTAKYVAQKK